MQVPKLILFLINEFTGYSSSDKNVRPSIPKRDPSKNSTSPCAGPTVGANCRGIVTADVLSVRT